ncbi:hypothetical protein [Burkholderia sp. BDU5]|uniref:hypothetical protein n=1 Tax=Burkholderia sp. BDU5 TaxID=1385590 RepID=UPI0018D20B58|nr:hypothetical protein [Burkholderia sp. BDU5]
MLIVAAGKREHRAKQRDGKDTESEHRHRETARLARIIEHARKHTAPRLSYAEAELDAALEACAPYRRVVRQALGAQRPTVGPKPGREGKKIGMAPAARPGCRAAARPGCRRSNRRAGTWSAPSSLRAFEPSSLRAFEPSSLRAFEPSSRQINGSIDRQANILK